MNVKGNPADSRMRSTAKRRGIEITSISRPIRPSDFRDFDLILAMDKSNRGVYYYYLLVLPRFEFSCHIMSSITLSTRQFRMEGVFI